MRKNIRFRLVVTGLALLLIGPAMGATGFRYFNDSYDLLQKKACTLQSHGTLAAFNADDKTIQSLVAAKTGVLDNFFGMASSHFGKDDVSGAGQILKNEARMNWDIKKFKKATATEALYCSEATIKFLLEKDKTPADPNRPAMLPDYEKAALKLVSQAETAFVTGKYAKMRKLFYHALWIAYPVTSKAPFVEPKD
jgi:hypothetical protein